MFDFILFLCFSNQEANFRPNCRVYILTVRKSYMNSSDNLLDRFIVLPTNSTTHIIEK